MCVIETRGGDASTIGRVELEVGVHLRDEGLALSLKCI